MSLSLNIADTARFTLTALALAGPLVYALLCSRSTTRADFVYNSARTGFIGTLSGVVCGNVGIGTFIGIGLFAEASPVVGLSLALSYTLGLLISAAIAPFLLRISRRYQVHGLVDLIVVRHGVRHPVAIWIPIAFVFLLRAAVQLLALSAILMALTGLEMPLAVLASTLLTGGYTAIGGYRIAVKTDIFQAAIIAVGLAALCVANLGAGPLMDFSFDLGPYEWPLLVGIWLFIPFSAVLAIDNWQRIASAQSPATARSGFFAGAAVCLMFYLAIVWLGMEGHISENLIESLHGSVLPGFSWLVDLMLIAAIMSTLDTFVMPLISGLERSRLSLSGMRAAVFAIFMFIAFLALAAGDFLNTVIAAFSALVAFLPAVLVTVLSTRTRPVATIVSVNLGISASLAWLAIDINTASFIGLIAASAPFLYGYVTARLADILTSRQSNELLKQAGTERPLEAEV